MFLPLGPGYCSTRYTRSQFRDDSVLICHPGRPSGARSIRDPEADRFYSWVPDTVRLATLAHSSGTTKGIMFSSQFRDDSVFCYLNSSYESVIPEIASLSSCHPGNCVSNYPGSRSESTSILDLIISSC